MGYPSVVFPLLSPLFWLRSIYALSACVPLAWWCGCPPVVRLLMVGCGGVSFLCSSFVFPLFSGMIRRQNATQYHTFLTVATPSGFRTLSARCRRLLSACSPSVSRRFPVALSLLECTGNAPLLWLGLFAPVRRVVSSFYRRFLRLCRLLDVTPF